jgi:hypothetical protein
MHFRWILKLLNSGVGNKLREASYRLKKKSRGKKKKGKTKLWVNTVFLLIGYALNCTLQYYAWLNSATSYAFNTDIRLMLS